MKTAVLVNRRGEYYLQTCCGVAPRYDGDDEGYVSVATVAPATPPLVEGPGPMTYREAVDAHGRSERARRYRWGQGWFLVSPQARQLDGVARWLVLGADDREAQDWMVVREAGIGSEGQSVGGTVACAHQHWSVNDACVGFQRHGSESAESEAKE